MGRKKGSLNKKNLPVQLDFKDKIEFDEKTEVCMTKELENSVLPVDIVETVQEIENTSEELEVIQQELDLARMELENTKREIEEKKKQMSAIPKAEHSSSTTTSIAIKDNSLAEKIKTQKEYDNVLVTGKFHNLRAPGQSVKLPYHKYAEDPIKWYTFSHGQIYTIPRGFADQINGGTENDPCYYSPQFIKNEGIIVDPDDPGTGIHSVDTSNKKYMFSPVGFS